MKRLFIVLGVLALLSVVALGVALAVICATLGRPA